VRNPREFWLLLAHLKYTDTKEWEGRIFDNEDAAHVYKVSRHERVVHVIVPRKSRRGPLRKVKRHAAGGGSKGKK
jgi:hypothetical protein